jgi:TorA maturation chaperone TorD
LYIQIMQTSRINTSDIHLIHFYTRCLNFPYEELVYELQHLFRTLEGDIEDEEEYQFVEQALAIVNLYQGEEPQLLRSDYQRLFVQTEEQKPLCPIIATQFLSRYARHYDAEQFNELLFESGLHVSADEMGDTLTNQLEYLSILCESYRFGESDVQELHTYLHDHILVWIPAFCDVLYKAATVAFYRETAEGLKNYIHDLAGRFVNR